MQNKRSLEDITTVSKTYIKAIRPRYNMLNYSVLAKTGSQHNLSTE